jgi:hypothetical protein
MRTPCRAWLARLTQPQPCRRGTHALSWVSPPKSVLLVMKWGDAKALEAGRKMIEWVRSPKPFWRRCATPWRIGGALS